MFNFTIQYLNQKLTLIRLNYAKTLESLTANDIRRVHFRFDFEFAKSVSRLEKLEILKKIHRKIGYKNFQDTLDYLGIDPNKFSD